MKKKIIILALLLVIVFGIIAVVIFTAPARAEYTVGNAEISDRIESIRISCDNGTLYVMSTDKNYIGLKENDEDGGRVEDPTLKWAVTGDTLRVVCESGTDRKYIITVPHSTVLDDLDIEGDNAVTNVTDTIARDMSLRTGDGDLNVERCKCIDAFIIENIDGKVNLFNTFSRRFDISSASSKVRLVSPTFQRKCNISTKTGDIDIIAPYDSKFSISEYHGKGSFSSDFENDKEGGRLNLRTSGGHIRIENSGNKGSAIASEANGNSITKEFTAPVTVPATTAKPTTKPAKTTKPEKAENTTKAVKTEDTTAAEKTTKAEESSGIKETKKSDKETSKAAASTTAAENTEKKTADGAKTTAASKETVKATEKTKAAKTTAKAGD